MHIARLLGVSRKKKGDAVGALEALRSGNVNQLRRLHLNGYDFKTEVDGEIPLYHACAGGQVAAVKYLVDIGAVSQYRRCVSVTPSTRKGRQIRKLLIRYEAFRRPDVSTSSVGRVSEDPPFSAVFIAAKTGDVEKLRALACQGKNVWAKHPVFQRTPLFYAAAGAHVEAVEYLLNSGAEDSDCMCELTVPEGPKGDKVREMLSKQRRRRASEMNLISRLLVTMPSLDPHDLTCSSELPGELEPCLDAEEFSLPGISEQAALSPETSGLDSPPSESPHATGDGENLGSPRGTCCVCLESAAKFACVPCGHLCMCSECWQGIQDNKAPKCPICRKATTHALEIFNV